jgi:hypothetical protein
MFEPWVLKRFDAERPEHEPIGEYPDEPSAFYAMCKCLHERYGKTWYVAEGCESAVFDEKTQIETGHYWAGYIRRGREVE